MEELYKIYEDSVTVQEQVINATNKKLKKARDAHNISEIKRLNTLLRVLYEEKWELEEKRRQLKSYIT